LPGEKGQDFIFARAATQRRSRQPFLFQPGFGGSGSDVVGIKGK
jgi:hypothetical protein